MNDFTEVSYLSDISICDGLVGWFNENEENHHTGKIMKPKGGKVADDSFKISTDFSFQMEAVVEKNDFNGRSVLIPYLKELQESLEEYITVYPFSNKGHPFNIDMINIQYYKPYQGFKKFHYERSQENNFGRHLAFMTYLNSVEDGGGTEFLHQRNIINAVKGKTVIFPADWTHAHRGIVSPTEEKYIITGWYIFKTSNQRIRYDIRKIGE